MCSHNLRCACEIKFGKMSDVRACGAFVGVQSEIKILQVSLQLLNKSGPNSLIFFNESSKMALKVRNLTDVLGILMLFN